jgi:hypothetical protein
MLKIENLEAFKTKKSVIFGNTEYSMEKVLKIATFPRTRRSLVKHKYSQQLRCITKYVTAHNLFHEFASWLINIRSQLVFQKI